METSVQDKIRQFRNKAQQIKLKAAMTSEISAKRMYEDAAQQWQELAERLETKGRSY